MKDIIEQMEDSAERQANKLFDGKQWKYSGCMELIEPGHEQTVSENPFSMPVCPACARAAFEYIPRTTKDVLKEARKHAIHKLSQQWKD